MAALILPLVFLLQDSCEADLSEARRACSMSESALCEKTYLTLADDPQKPDCRARALNSLGEFYHEHARYGEAQSRYDEALAIQEQRPDCGAEQLARILFNLAEVHLDLYLAGHESGESLRRSKNFGRQALAICEERLGPSHPSVALALNAVGRAYYFEGQDNVAKTLLERALSIQEKGLDPVHTDIAVTLNNLAALHRRAKQYQKAEPLLQRALAINQQVFGAYSAIVAKGAYNLAELYSAEADYVRAEPLFRLAIQIWERTNHTSDLITAMRSYALLLRKTRRKAEAKRLNVRATELRRLLRQPQAPK